MKTVTISGWMVLVTISFSSAAFAQGGNTCAQASANLVSLPFNSGVQDLCGKGNDYQGANSCASSNATQFAGQDYMYAVIPPADGFLTIDLTNIQIPSGSVTCSPVITVFKDCPGTGTCINTGETNAFFGLYNTVIQVEAGQTYFILLDAAVYSTYYSNCFKYKIKISFNPIVKQPSCTNMGFDSGNLKGWTATTGKSITGGAGAQMPIYSINGFGASSGRHTVVTGGNDPCAGFPRVAPGGSGSSVRLGNNSGGSEAEQLRQTFYVSESNSSFTYKYAVVFQDPGHPKSEQPFFKAMLKDKDGQVITCSEFVVAAAASLPGFLNAGACPGSKYKPWSTVNVDLSNYVGEYVTIEFTTGDCTQGGHFGYAYIDAFCSPSLITASADTICPGESTLLQAPVGYATYSWMPDGSTATSITVSPTVSTTYTLSLKSFNGCTSKYFIPVTVAPVPVANFSYDAPACDLPVIFTNTSAVSSGNIKGFSWNFGASGNPSASTSLGTVSSEFPGPGTYPVSLRVETVAGCSSSISKTIVVPPCVFSARITGANLCPGESAFLSISYSFGVAPYQVSWDQIPGYSLDTLTVQPAQTTVYKITVKDADGFVATDTAVVKIVPPVNLQAEVTDVNCYSAANGMIKLQPGGTPPYQIYWSSGAVVNPLTNLGPGAYSVRVKDSNGCSDSISVQVREPEPVFTASHSQVTTCGFSNGMLQVQVNSGGTAPFQYSLDGSSYQSSGEFTGLAGGTYTVTLKDAQSCFLSLNLHVDTLSYPRSALASFRDAFCGNSNGMIRLTGVTGGFGPYQYSLNHTDYSAVHFPLEIGHLAAGNYTLQILDSNNCVFQVDSFIRQWQGPSSLNMEVRSAICGLDNASLKVLHVLGGQSPYTFSFNHSNFSSIQQFQALKPGSAMISVIDANQCQLDSVLVIPFLQDISISANLLQAVSCAGGNDGKVEAKILSGSNPIAVSWAHGPNNLIALGLFSGTYEVTATDSVGCRDTAHVFVPEPEPLVFSTRVKPATCGEPTGEIHFYGVSGGMGPYVYSADGQQFSAQPEMMDIARGNYTIWIKDQHACLQNAKVWVNMLSYPVAADLVVNDATCGFANGSLQLSSLQGGIAPFRIRINQDPVNQLSLPFNLNNLEAGNLSLLISDSSGCSLKLDTLIRQWRGPESVLTHSHPATCEKDNGVLYIDSVFGGTLPLESKVGEASFSEIMQYTGLAPEQTRLTLRDAHGCLFDTLLTIPAIDMLSISISALKTVSCFGGSDGSLQVEVNAGPSPYVFYWEHGDSSAISEDLSSGLYKVEVQDSAGCLANASITINDPSQISTSVIAPGFVCQGQEARFTPSASGGSGSLKIIWEDDPHTGTNRTVSPDSSTWYHYFAQDNLGCTVHDSLYLLVRDLPTGEILVDERSGCRPVCANLQIESSSLIESYSWNFSDGAQGRSSEQKHCFHQTGTPEIIVVIADQYGCKNTLDGTGLIQVFPIPESRFTADSYTADIMNPVIRFSQLSGTMKSYSWDFGDGEQSIFPDPEHTFPDTGTYQVCLNVLSDKGCSDVSCDEVKILPVPVFFAPNAFTPNGDGHNEFFKIVASYVVNFKIEIFDRWGEVLYVTESSQEGWDGTFKGRAVQSDTYVWRVTMKDSLMKDRQVYGRVMVIN